MNTEAFLQQFYRLMNLYQAAQKQPRKYRENLTLYAAQSHLMEVIGAQPGISGKEAAEQLAISKGAVSQTVKKLAEKGLILRMPSVDGRESRLVLSPEGEKVYASHRQLHQPLMDELHRISAQIPPQTENVLQQLFTTMEGHLLSIIKEE